MISVLDIESRDGVPFRVVYDPEKGNTENGTVEFFDRRYTFTEHGQFVSSYYRSTLLEDFPSGTGLDLQGGVDAWYVDAGNMVLVTLWLRSLA